MKINALFKGRQVQIVQLDREGSRVHVVYIDGAANGALVSTVMNTSAYSEPDVVLSTSAFWLG